MSRLWDYAQRIFDTACRAADAGQPADLAILVNGEGGLQVMDPSGWTLDALQAHTGARMLFRVTHERGRVKVDGREGVLCCRMESAAASLRPGPLPRYRFACRGLLGGSEPLWENAGAACHEGLPVPPPEPHETSLSNVFPPDRRLLTFA